MSYIKRKILSLTLSMWILLWGRYQGSFQICEFCYEVDIEADLEYVNFFMRYSVDIKVDIEYVSFVTSYIMSLTLSEFCQKLDNEPDLEYVSFEL